MCPYHYWRKVQWKLRRKKMKHLLKRFMRFEKQHGSPEDMARVKQLAEDFVAARSEAS